MRRNIFAISLLIIFAILNSNQISAQAPDTIWTRNYGGTGNDWANEIIKTSDDNLLIVGSSERHGFSQDFYFIKLDENGDTIWTRVYGEDGWESAGWVTEMNDGSYFVTGQTSEGEGDIVFLNVDSNGGVNWQKTYGGESVEGLAAGVECMGNSYIFTGITSSYGAGRFDAYFMRVNFNGDTLWTKTYGGPDHDLAVAIVAVDESNFLALCNFDVMGDNDPRMSLLKLDACGDTISSISYDNLSCLGATIIETSDENYMILANEYDSLGHYNILLLKVDATGDILWSNRINESYNTYAITIMQAADGGFVIGGSSGNSTGENLFIAKADENGDLVWTRTVDVFYNFGNQAISIVQLDDNSYVIAGELQVTNMNSQAYVTRLAPDRVAIDDQGFADLPITIALYPNYPNPFNASTTISYELQAQSPVTIDIYDMLGRKVAILYNGIQSAGNHSVNWNADRYSSGVYFYKLTTGDYTESDKMMLVK